MTHSELSMPLHRTRVAEWLTVERTAYAGAALVGLGLRAYSLALRPLTPAEALEAWPAWQAAIGRPYDLVGLSPLLFHLQRWLMIPFGGGDAVARWPLALVGGLAALLFYALRDRLGRPGALAAAFLWALSPLAVFFGRTGSEYGLVPPLALALLATVNTYLSTRSGRWLVWAGVALGLLLAAGAGAYTVLLAALPAAFLWPATWRAVAEGIGAQRRNVALALFLTAVLAATGFLTILPGLSLAVDLLGRWFRALLPGGTAPAGLAPYTAWDLARRLLVSEPLLLVAGVAGFVLSLRRGDRFGVFAGLATAIALLVALLGPGRHPGDLGLVVLGLVLLSGPVVAGIVRHVAGWHGETDPYLLAALSLALLAAAAISLPAAFYPAGNEEYRRLAITVALVTSGVCLILWITFSLWGSWDVVRRTLPAIGLLAGSIWGVSQLVGINYDTSVLHYGGVLAEFAGPGWSDLHGEISSLSPQYAIGKDEAAIDVWVPPDAQGSTRAMATMLLWELKDDPNVQLVTAVPAVPAAFIITPIAPGAEAGDLEGIPATYSGTSFDLVESWRPDSLAGGQAWLRWLLYREAATPAQKRQAVLWVDRTVTGSTGRGQLPAFDPQPAQPAPLAPQGGMQP